MDSDVQQIKDRVKSGEIVGQYVKLKRSGRTCSGRCPFHKERTPSFHVSPERGTYKCFGCGEGGDVFSFLQKMDGTDFPTVLRQMAERIPRDKPSLLELSGVGPAKLERYGDAFLELLTNE